MAQQCHPTAAMVNPRRVEQQLNNGGAVFNKFTSCWRHMWLRVDFRLTVTGLRSYSVSAY
jgi:hypothetical protein